MGGGARLVDVEIVERLENVEVALPRRNNSEPRLPPAGKHQAVGDVDPQKRQCRRNLALVETLLLGHRMVAGTDGQPAGRHPEGTGNDCRNPVQRAVHGRRQLDGVLDAFEADPQPGEARHGEPEQAVVEDLLHPGRRQDGDHRVDEGVFGLVGGGRGFTGVVVAHQRQHPAPRRRTPEIGVFQGVSRPVHPRSLAVPDAEDAVETALAAHLRLLRPPQRRRGKILVHRRLEDDVGRRQNVCRTLELLVEAAERRTAIAGDIAGGALAHAAIAGLLHQGQPDHRLGPGQQDAALSEIVLVAERDGRESHRASVCVAPPGGMMLTCAARSIVTHRPALQTPAVPWAREASGDPFNPTFERAPACPFRYPPRTPSVPSRSSTRTSRARRP